MFKLSAVLLFFLFSTQCHKTIENPQKKVIVTLKFKNNFSGFIIIENHSDRDIVLNSFSSSIAILILEQQSLNGGSTRLLGTPPVPPDNLENYNIILKKNQQIKIPIQGLEILNNLKSNKIRSKIFFKIKGENKYRIEFSEWYSIDK